MIAPFPQAPPLPVEVVDTIEDAWAWVEKTGCPITLTFTIGVLAIVGYVMWRVLGRNGIVWRLIDWWMKQLEDK